MSSVGELGVAQEAIVLPAHPRACVQLVDCDRRIDGVEPLTLGLPGADRGGALRQAVHDGGRGRRMLLLEGERVGLQRQQLLVRSEQLIFVDLSASEPRNEDLPKAGLHALAHDVAPAVPGVERSDHADPRGIRRPHREADAVHALVRDGMCAHFLIEPQVVALGEEVKVDLAENGAEAVGIVDLDGRPVVGGTQAIVPRECVWHLAGEEPGAVQGIQREAVTAFWVERRHRGRPRQKGAHGCAIAAVVQTEDRERVAVLAAHDCLKPRSAGGPFVSAFLGRKRHDVPLMLGSRGGSRR